VKKTMVDALLHMKTQLTMETVHPKLAVGE
jgi:hypothetical protein